MLVLDWIRNRIMILKEGFSGKGELPQAAESSGAKAEIPKQEVSQQEEYEIVEKEILPEKMICPDCGGITLVGLEFCDKCGGELMNRDIDK